MDQDELKSAFIRQIRTLDRNELLWLADEAIGAAELVLKDLGHNAASAKLEAYQRYLIRHSVVDIEDET
jgi:hypothetical protein